MNKTELKTLIKEAFLTEKKSTLLNENAPGFDNRKQGEALPTLESIKAAYQAKKLEEKAEETKEETEATKELTAAVKDLSDAKKEAGLKEDKFVDAALEDLRTVINNLAHTSGIGKEEAAEMAIMHIEDMFMGGEELDEGEDKDDPGALAPVGTSTIYGTVKKYTELPNGQVKVDYDTGDTQVLQKERGVWVEVDYIVGKSTTTEDKTPGKDVSIAEDTLEEDATPLEKDYWADYTDIGMFYLEKGTGKERFNKLTDNEYEELGEKIVKQLYGGDVSKAYDDIVRGKKRGSSTDVSEETINESVITEADRIVESFRK